MFAWGYMYSVNITAPGKSLEKSSLPTVEVPGRHKDLKGNFHWPQHETAASSVPDCAASTTLPQERFEYIFKI